MTMQQVIADKLWRARLSTLPLGIFAAIALMLASVGIYAVISYSVRQRTQEIGIRMALMESLKPVCVGVGVGLAIALAMSRLMVTLLYRVSTKDPYTLAAVTLVLMAAAVIAAYVPAYRATKVDPLIALRHE